MLGNVYKETGEMQKATDALRRAIELLPNQPSPHISLAAILSQQGDRAGAAGGAKEGCRPEPHRREPTACRLRSGYRAGAAQEGAGG